MTCTQTGYSLVQPESCPINPLEQKHWTLAGTLSVPGRANLIGEHMDYNGGHSLPFAIALGLRFALRWRKRSDEKSHLCVGPAADGSGKWLLLSGAENPFPKATIDVEQSVTSDPHGSFSAEHRRAGVPYITGAWHLSGTATPEETMPLPAPGLPPGFDLCLLIEGDLPPGAGLSSSAALSLGLLISFRHARFLLNHLSASTDEHCKPLLKSSPCDLHTTDTRLHLARLAQLVEHRYAGTPCGLMDQLTIVMTPSESTREPNDGHGSNDRAHTQSPTLTHQRGFSADSLAPAEGAPALQTYMRITFPAPLETGISNRAAQEPPALFPFAAAPLFDRYDTYILHSGKEHDLSDGQYAHRREECRAALSSLNSSWNKQEATLGDFFRTAQLSSTKDNFQRLSSLHDLLSGTVWASDHLKARAKFVGEEIQRVTLACEALASGNAHLLAQLLAQAQDGLARDYLVSCPEIDCAVNLLRAIAEKLGMVAGGRELVPAMIGPRMMGGGFGGSLIFLLHQDCAKSDFEQHMNNALKHYQQQTSCAPRLLKTHKAAGISWKRS